MTKENDIKKWTLQNRSICIEVLRIYLGISLLLKGINFLINQDQTIEYLSLTPFSDFISYHLVVFIHIVGGLMLALGLLTRLAALVQIPLLIGAIVFVHWSQNVELVMLVLFLLCIFVIYGGGNFSIDYLIANKSNNKDS